MEQKENPLHILRFSKRMLRGLKINDIRTLVKHVGRGLQAIHHPDKGGDTETSAAINQALAMVESADTPTLKGYVAGLLKMTKTEKDIARLENEAKKCAALLERNSKFVIGYMRLASSSRYERTIFDRGKKIVVSDTTHAKNIGMMAVIARQPVKEESGKCVVIRVGEGGIYKTFFRRNVSGKFTRQNEKEKLCADTRLVGVLTEMVVTEEWGGIDTVLKKLSGVPKDLPTFEVKGRSRHVVDVRWNGNRYGVEQFLQFVPYLSLRLSDLGGDYLFSITQKEGCPPYVSLEGRTIAKPPEGVF